MSAKSPLDLEESFFETDHVRWRRVFPWIHLGEAVRLSLDPRKLILAMLGLVTYVALIFGAEQLPFFVGEHQSARLVAFIEGDRDLPLGPESELLRREYRGYLDGRIKGAAATWYDHDFVVTRPVVALMTASSVASVAEAVTRLIIGLFVVSLFGGAIARITALQFAGDHPSSLVGSLRFSISTLLTSAVGPMLPLVAGGVLVGMIAVGGLISTIPIVGPPIGGIFWGLTLLFAFFIVLLSIGLVLSWPIMVAGTAVEATDSFDALSRGFSYAFSRPIYVIFLVLIAASIGVVLATIVAELAAMTEAASTHLFSTTGTAIWDASTEHVIGHWGWAFWHYLVHTAVAAFPIAYFWTAATVIYFLLRLCVDAMPLDRIYIPDDPAEDELAPLVGVAATERREKAQKADAAEAAAKGAEPESTDESQTSESDSKSASETTE